MLKIKLHAFGAAKDRASCEDFLSGHQKVLKDYGIENITTNSESWFDNPNVYGVLAVDQQTGEIVGGIRVHKADGAHLLPVEEAVGDLDPAVHEIVERYTEDGVGELCALWNSRSVAKIGISTLLTRAGISIINQLDFRILMGICADYTLPMFTRVGFVVDNSRTRARDHRVFGGPGKGRNGTAVFCLVGLCSLPRNERIVHVFPGCCCDEQVGET